jgi:hypothetical protein
MMLSGLSNDIGMWALPLVGCMRHLRTDFGAMLVPAMSRDVSGNVKPGFEDLDSRVCLGGTVLAVSRSKVCETDECRRHSHADLYWQCGPARDILESPEESTSAVKLDPAKQDEFLM